MNKKNIKKEWLEIQQRQQQFSGWDFSEISNDFIQEQTSWSYTDIAKSYLTPEKIVLDMGTGGGELLTTFQHPPAKTSVTEGWLPNYHLLLKNLAPKGINVQFVAKDDLLRFPSNSFDIVLNSHASFRVSEVKRVLKPHGFFITQQVGDLNGLHLASRLIPDHNKSAFTHHLSSVVTDLRNHQFKILRQYEEYPEQKFFSLEALIYYARTIQWEFPNFSVETHLNELLQLEEELQRIGFVYNQQHRFLIVAQLS